MRKLKPTDYRLLYELVKNPRLSDRQIARVLGSSQPTITKKRTAFEKNGLLEYTAIPNFKKLGYEILAFTFGRWNLQKYPNTRVEEMKKFIEEHPNIIFISTGSGSGWDRIGVSVHKDYSDYLKTIQGYQNGWGKYFETFSSFIVSLQSDNILRDITFKYVAELMKKEHVKEEPGEDK